MKLISNHHFTTLEYNNNYECKPTTLSNTIWHFMVDLTWFLVVGQLDSFWQLTSEDG